MLSNYIEYITFYLKTAPYKDLVEIFFFSTVIYVFLCWLRRDTEHNLLLYFYAYCLLFFGAYYADLQTIRFLLFMSAPVIALFFMIIHQETLQKNFIKLTVTPATLSESCNWIDEFLKCCLLALNRQKESIIIIERNDHLKSLLAAPYYIYAELKKDVFDILIDKHVSSNDYMIWINQQGKLVAINATWRTPLDETWISKEIAAMHVWKQQALFFTSKTDALVIKINALTRNFDCVMQGMLQENISADQIAKILKKHVHTSTTIINAKPSIENKQL